jgi:hypothetical protein
MKVIKFFFRRGKKMNFQEKYYARLDELKNSISKLKKENREIAERFYNTLHDEKKL